MANAMKKRGIKKPKSISKRAQNSMKGFKTKKSKVAQLKKGILNPRSGTVELNIMGRPKTKLKGSPKTKLKIAKEEIKASKKAIKEGRIKL